MVQNAAERKKDVRSVNAGQSCCNTELKIVGNINMTGLLNFSNYNTFLHAALNLVTLKFSLFAYRRKSSSHASTPGVFRNFSKE